MPLPVVLIAAPTGAGKTEAAAREVASGGGACWLADRLEDVAAAVTSIERHGGSVGRVAPLDGKTDGKPNCLHPDVIRMWQGKGYSYQAGYCRSACERRDDLGACPFLASLRDLKNADSIVATKALARTAGFFGRHGNKERGTILMDEDPVGLLRPLVPITRLELDLLTQALDRVDKRLQQMGERGAAALAQSATARRIAEWCWEQIGRQPANGQPEAVAVPRRLRPSRAVLRRTKAAQKAARTRLFESFHRLMVSDPHGTVRNVVRDLFDLVRRAAGNMVFVTARELFFHLRVPVPRDKRVIVLDATGNPELLRPLFAPRPVRVLCDQRVRPAGRVIQFMDFNGPRSYLNKTPAKLVRIIDAIGDLHPAGIIVLISHRTAVEALAKASRHRERIRTAHFGALRGRNDLEPGRGEPITCHIVAGSPKTTEGDRRQLALAVYGRTILPFPDLMTVRRVVSGAQPSEVAGDDEPRELLWEVRLKGYADLRMQAVYDHSVTAELTHAADRARVLIHKAAVVYLVTNEPCPRLWFAEKCLAADYLDLTPKPRADFEKAYQTYVARLKELLHAGKAVGNADVCRALGRPGTWGHRYWRRFLAENRDALEGERKVQWKTE